MAEQKKMTVAEMLAAARKVDGGGGAAPAPAPAEEAAAPEAAPPAAAAPKAPAAKPAPGAKLSVADMLAAARSGDKGGGAAPAAPKEKPAAKPAPAAAAAKASPVKKEAAAAKPAEPVDTQSILTAARAGAKVGPMSKAEAASKAPAAAVDAKKAKAKEAIVVPPMPVKPDYAKKAVADRGAKEQVAERRAFLFGMSALAVGFTALTATTAAWTLGTVRFMFPNILREPPSRFTVGFPDQFAPGQVEEKFKAQFGIWVVNTEYHGEPQIFALKSVCTHLGCTPNWLEAEQKFKCPCHGSGFYKDGINFEGPAPRPLERYAISIASDGQIQVDKSKTFQEEMGAWADPASFIPA